MWKERNCRWRAQQRGRFVEELNGPALDEVHLSGTGQKGTVVLSSTWWEVWYDTEHRCICSVPDSETSRSFLLSTRKIKIPWWAFKSSIICSLLIQSYCPYFLAAVPILWFYALIVLYSVLTLCLVKRYVPSLECASPPSNLCHSWYTLWCNDEPCGRTSPPPSASLTSLLRDPPHVRVPLTRLDTEWVLP